MGREARNLQVGHSYLLDSGRPVTAFTQFTRVLADDIIPLLQEYCYEDYSTLAQILGKGLVDEGGQRIREELFAPDRWDDLVQALLAPYPEIATSPEATSLQDAVDEPEETPDDDDEESEWQT